MQRTLPTLLLSLLLAASAQADVAVGLGVGTTGADLAVSYPLQPQLNLRGMVSGFSTSKNDSSGTDVDFDADLKLFNLAALADYHPFAGSFRLSGGVVYDGNKLSLRGKPKNGSTYKLNGVTYNASDVGSVAGEVKWDKPGVYLGLGWGNAVARKGLSFGADLGVIYSGKPSSSLKVSCGSAIAGTAACTQLQNDAAAEERKLKDDADKVKYWPVARVALHYAF